MDCPSCGWLNAPDPLNCANCGFDFHASEHNALAEWPIVLSEWQKVGVFWSMSWPAWLVYVALRFYLSSSQPVIYNLVPVIVFFCLEAVLTLRLFRRDYDSFRIYVVRERGQQHRTLPMRDLILVWPRIVGIQLLCLISCVAVERLIFGSIRISPPLLIFFFGLGPAGIHLAMRGKYPGFRLQAYGFK